MCAKKVWILPCFFCIYFVQQKDAILNTSRNLGWKLKNLFSLNQEKTKWALVNEKSQQKFPWNHFSQKFFREIDFTEKRTFFFVFDTMCHFSSYALLRIDKSQIKFGRKCIIKSCKLLYANDWINHSAKMNWILIFIFLFRKKHSRTIFNRLFLLLTYSTQILISLNNWLIYRTIFASNLHFQVFIFTERPNEPKYNIPERLGTIR